MDIKTREDALFAPRTPKSYLLTFERKLSDLRCVSHDELINFFIKEKCVFGEDVKEKLKPLLQSSRSLSDLLNKILSNDDMIKDSYKWGDPLGCDFQVMKIARSTTKTTPLPQRFHCRVYIEEDESIIVSERETAPKNGISRVVHVAESRGLLFPKPEHKIIRITRCEIIPITQKIRSFIRKLWFSSP